MAKIAIGLDNWKLPIFERRLKEAGYEIDQKLQITADALILTVHTEDTQHLSDVILACQEEARNTNKPKKKFFNVRRH